MSNTGSGCEGYCSIAPSLHSYDCPTSSAATPLVYFLKSPLLRQPASTPPRIGPYRERIKRVLALHARIITSSAGSYLFAPNRHHVDHYPPPSAMGCRKNDYFTSLTTRLRTTFPPSVDEQEDLFGISHAALPPQRTGLNSRTQFVRLMRLSNADESDYRLLHGSIFVVWTIYAASPPVPVA